MKKERTLSEIARLFLKLGIIGFGGPAVHIAMMEEEVVRKRRWVTGAHFLDLVGATNLIPGPNSTEMTMHIGQEKAGVRGLVVAGCCFILPAILITSAIAWAYVKYGKLAEVEPFLYGIKPAVIAIVAAAMISLGRKALKSVLLGIIGIAATVAVLMGANEIIVLFSAGAAGVMFYFIKGKHSVLPGIFPQVLLQVLSPELAPGKIFLIFLKLGAILYGSGYVLFAFMDAELVSRGYISGPELVDAIAVGQFTPGPVFSAATFVGYLLGGWWGAVLATVAIFLPSFLFVGLLNPLIPALRRSKIMASFMDAINIASVAIILAVLFQLSGQAVIDWRTAAISVAGFVAVFLFRINAAFIVLGGALAGYLLLLI